jgi:hypothetical protein
MTRRKLLSPEERQALLGIPDDEARASAFNYPHFGLLGRACLSGTRRDSVRDTSSFVRGVVDLHFMMGLGDLGADLCTSCETEEGVSLK